MRCIATFDIGTTAVKAVLVGYDGQVLTSCSKDIPTMFDGDHKEQDPSVWWKAFCELSHDMMSQCPNDIASGIVMSGQMQDVIPVDHDLQPVCPAILYSDSRAEIEAEELLEAVGEEKILEITGNHCDGSLSLPKIMWLKKNMPDLYAKTCCFLISSKDFVIAQLTGICAGDYTACSTACAMDINEKIWSDLLLTKAGIEIERMPRLHASHEIVGRVTEAASKESSFPAGTPVYAGVGDAGATTLASGIMKEGQYNINLGTSGWVATVSEKAAYNAGGIFNLAAMPEGKIINVVPFLNAGNVHRWLSLLFSGQKQEPDYREIELLIKSSVPGSHGLFALPYLLGERFPVLDPTVRGAFAGITPETEKGDFVRAMLEGTAYSIRQGMEMIGEPPENISVIGGGGRSAGWCQILADVLGHNIIVFQNSDTLPSRAIAAAAFIGEGIHSNYQTFVDRLDQDANALIYTPNHRNHEFYNTQYQRAVHLYTALESWFRS